MKLLIQMPLYKEQMGRGLYVPPNAPRVPYGNSWEGQNYTKKSRFISQKIQTKTLRSKNKILNSLYLIGFASLMELITLQHANLTHYSLSPYNIWKPRINKLPVCFFAHFNHSHVTWFSARLLHFLKHQTFEL